jgi:hypothetical protein
MKTNNFTVLIIVLSLVILIGCDHFGGKELRFKHDLYEAKYWTSVYDIENMTDNELKKEVQRKEKITVRDFYKPYNFGVEFIGDETFFYNQFNSVSTLEEAENESRLWISKRNSPYLIYKIEKIMYIGENDYYYQYHFEYSNVNVRNSSNYIRCIIYKENAMHVVVDSGRNVIHSEIRALNYNSVKDLLDLENFYWNFWSSFSRIIWRDFSENENEFIYTCYHVNVIGGDWNIDDIAYLVKTIINVDKDTGEYKYNNIIIKGPNI